jgi:hypothetical protein
MKTPLNPCVIFVAWSIATPLVSAQQSQVPVLTATSLQRGNSITRSSTARTIGTVLQTAQSKDVTRIAAVKVMLRSFAEPKTPYEVQCFFCAKDPSKARYIFDVKKTLSSAKFDDIHIFGRDLFGGSQTIDNASTSRTIIGYTQYGDFVTGKLDISVRLTTTVPGSTFEGWIVRIISAEKLVRMEASLQELKSLAERESLLLDKLASDVPLSQ